MGAFADLGAVSRLKADQRAKLEAAPATWVDRAKGLVSVPIDRAMALVTADIARDPNLASVAAASGSGGCTRAEAPAANTDEPKPPAKEECSPRTRRGQARENASAPADKKK